MIKTVGSSVNKPGAESNDFYTLPDYLFIFVIFRGYICSVSWYSVFKQRTGLRTLKLHTQLVLNRLQFHELKLSIVLNISFVTFSSLFAKEG